MATPNMPSSAQDIINNFLSGGYASQAQANPYRVNVDPFKLPDPVDSDGEDSKSPTDPCPEGYIYDPVIKSCVPIQEESSDRPEEIDRDKMMYDQMKRDNSTIFGASNTLDDYLIDTRGSDDILLRFDPNIGKPNIPFMPLANAGVGLLDSFFGGNKRRENKFNQAMQTYTDAGYGQQLNNGTFQVYNPQQYYNTVQSNPLQGRNASGGSSTMTVGQAVDSVMNLTPQVYDPLTGSMRSTTSSSGGSPIAQDLTGGLLGTSPLTTVDSQGNRKRNDAVYRSNVAKNIERNKASSPYGTSGFKEGFGFTRGR
jgi:hypothetical protein